MVSKKVNILRGYEMFYTHVSISYSPIPFSSVFLSLSFPLNNVGISQGKIQFFQLICCMNIGESVFLQNQKSDTPPDVFFCDVSLFNQNNP